MMLKIKNKIKLVVSDFDGIFTDGCIIINSDGSTSKKLSYLDIMAVSMLKKNDIKFAIISGEKAAAIDYLATKFDLDEVHQGIRNKAPVLEQIMQKYGVSAMDTAYIGDDFNDIDSLMLVENRFCVPNANYKVKNIPNISITTASGGNGAFRELVDSILF